MRKFYPLMVAPLLVCSCAFVHQEVTLKPEVNVAATDIGKGRAIQLKTVDERTSAVIGSRGMKGGAAASAEITSTQDVLAVVQTALLDGLKRKGYRPTVEEGSVQHGLRVDIRNLEYGVTPGIFTGTLRTEVALKAGCIVNGTQSYDRMYRGEDKDSVFFVQFASANERYLNSALSKAIESLLDDPKLQACLAQ
ncbi:MAG TPA: YajG family lipoprotein [Candidatus Binatia bacterium]|jgi:uncharacterized lipoprotein